MSKSWPKPPVPPVMSVTVVPVPTAVPVVVVVVVVVVMVVVRGKLMPLTVVGVRVGQERSRRVGRLVGVL